MNTNKKRRVMTEVPSKERIRLATEALEMRKKGTPYPDIALALGYETDDQARREVYNLLARIQIQESKIPNLLHGVALQDKAESLAPIDIQDHIVAADCMGCKHERILSILRERSEKLANLIDAVSAMIDAEDWLK